MKADEVHALRVGDARRERRRADRGAPPARCGLRSTAAGGCWRSATAARRPTRWTLVADFVDASAAAGRRAPRSTSPPTRRSSPRSPTTSAPRRSSPARSSPTAAPATCCWRSRRAATRSACSTRWPRRAAASCVTIALVGYDGGRVAAEQLADHVIVTPVAAHPPHPGGAGHRLPPAAGAGRARHERRRRRARQDPRAGRGDRPGCRLPAVRLPPRPRAGPRRATCSTTSTACCSRSRARAAAVARFFDRLQRRGAAARGGRRASRCEPLPADRRARVRDPRQRAQPAPPTRLIVARQRHLRTTAWRSCSTRPTAATAIRSSTAPTAVRGSRSCAAFPTTGR